MTDRMRHHAVDGASTTTWRGCARRRARRGGRRRTRATRPVESRRSAPPPGRRATQRPSHKGTKSERPRRSGPGYDSGAAAGGGDSQTSGSRRPRSQLPVPRWGVRGGVIRAFGLSPAVGLNKPAARPARRVWQRTRGLQAMVRRGWPVRRRSAAISLAVGCCRGRAATQGRGEKKPDHRRR